MQEVFTETASRADLVKKLFSRSWNSAKGETEVHLRGWFISADKLDTPDRITMYDRSAADLIRECEEAIEQLKAYRATLTERYNHLATAPTVPVVKLTRRRSYYDKLVYFDLVTARRFIDDCTDVEESRQTFPGRERKQAIAAYREYVKAHPGIIAEMDIEKARWER